MITKQDARVPRQDSASDVLEVFCVIHEELYSIDESFTRFRELKKCPVPSHMQDRAIALYYLFEDLIITLLNILHDRLKHIIVSQVAQYHDVQDLPQSQILDNSALILLPKQYPVWQPGMHRRDSRPG